MALLTIFLANSVSAAFVAVTNDGFNLYLSDSAPTPYNDVYYYNSYSVSPNYYGYGYPVGYATQPITLSYASYGNYAYWYGGYYGYVSPVYGYYNYAPAYQYQHYVYQPTQLYCTTYWCYS